MRKALVIVFLLFCILTTTAYSSKVNNIDYNTAKLSITNNGKFSEFLKNELQSKYHVKVTDFQIGKTLENRDKIYTIYCFIPDKPLLDKRPSENIVDYLGLAAVQVKKGEQFNIKEKEIEFPEFIFEKQAGIVFTGIYDYDYDTFVIGGKTICEEGNQKDPQKKVVTTDGTIVNTNAITKIEVELNNGEKIITNVDENGYFILTFKPIYDIEEVQWCAKQLKNIKGLDKKGDVITTIEVKYIKR